MNLRSRVRSHATKSRRASQARWIPLQRLEDRTLLSVVNEFPLVNSQLPYAIATGPDNKLWFTTFAGEPGSFDPTTGVDTAATTGLAGETAIVAGPDGNLYLAYTDSNGGEVSKMDTTGHLLATYNLGADVIPNAITVGPDGALWTADTASASMTLSDGTIVPYNTADFSRITTAGQVTNYATNLYSVSGVSITTGPDGALWMAVDSNSTAYSDSLGNQYYDVGTSEIARLLPGSPMNVYDVGAENSFITGIAAGPGNAVYYTQAFNSDPAAVSTQELVGKITVNSDASINLTQYIITPDTTQGAVDPAAITAGNDGNLWISEFDAQALLRLNPTTGVSTTYSVPTSTPALITTGPDGNLWFTEPYGNILGQVDLAQLQPTVAITANGEPVSAMAEIGFTGPVATFTTNLPGTAVSSFAASISWGDGNTSDGTIAFDSVTQTFTVTGSNTYLSPGSFPVKVTITSPEAPAPATATTNAQVSGSILASGTSISHVEKTAFTDVVATFIGPAPADSYSATIDWGDGGHSNGTIVTTSAGYQVRGTHTYATQGHYAATVTISDTHQSTSVVCLVNITDIPLTVTGDTVQAILPGWAIGIVATFTDDPGMNAANFAVVVNWGDGSSSGALIVQNPFQSNQYFVVGIHQYKKRGTYTTAITVTNLVEGSVVSATGKAVV